MKKFAGWSMGLAMLLLLPNMGSALDWQVDDALQISLTQSIPSGISGLGGLFKITNTTKNEFFYTFCLELDEWTSHAKYVEDVSDDIAMAGGRNTDFGDKLSGGTKYLVTQYWGGNPAYQNALALQLAIWYLEDEYYDKATNPSDWLSWYKANVGSQYWDEADAAYDYILTALKFSNYDNPAIGVLDTDDKTNGQGTLGQSYAYYIPEPATIFMLGLGVLGFAIGARRIRRRQGAE